MISLSKLFRSSKARHRTTGRCRPRLDVLESRSLLATLVVTSPLDDGPGTLRAQVGAANSGDTITFAHSLDGKTIHLTGGPVSEVGKSLTIQGPGAGQLTISGGGASGIFGFAADPGSSIDVSVSGLTLADGSAPVGGGAIEAQDVNLSLQGDVFRNNTAGVLGGAVDMGFASQFGVLTLTVADTRFEGNTASFGGAIQSTGFRVTISGSTFVDNASTQNFGGAAILGYGTATVTDSTFDGNQGGALVYFGDFSTGQTTLEVSGSTFRGNAIDGFGAAINSFGNATITDSTFTGNVATTDDLTLGGAIFSTGGDTTITGSDFAGNRAVAGSFAAGGAVYVNGGKADQFADTTFSDNEAASPGTASGGAIRWDSAGGASTDQTFAISGVTFERNRAVGVAPTLGSSSGGFANGGAIDLAGYLGTITIEDSAFVNNAAIGADAGLKFAGSAQGGAVTISGGTFLPDAPTLLNIRGTSFVGNEARSGSGNASAPAGAFAEGGGLYTFSSGYFSTTIADSLFEDNTAASGAGGFAADGTSLVLAIGGAIRSGTALDVTDTSFVGNSALGSDALAGRVGGGAIGGAISGASGTITGGLFRNNQALGGAGGDAVGTGTGGAGGDAIGGAIQTYGGLTVQSSTFTANKARGGKGGKGRGAGIGGAGGNGEGGGIAQQFTSPDAVLTVLDSSFTGNGAFGGQGGPGKHAGADGQGLGGGIALMQGTAIIKRAKFAGNHATTAGDNVYGPYTA